MELHENEKVGVKSELPCFNPKDARFRSARPSPQTFLVEYPAGANASQ